MPSRSRRDCGTNRPRTRGNRLAERPRRRAQLLDLLVLNALKVGREGRSASPLCEARPADGTGGVPGNFLGQWFAEFDKELYSLAALIFAEPGHDPHNGLFCFAC